MNQSQVLGIIVAVLIVLVILKIVKSTLKLLFTAIVIVALLIYLGVVSPKQLQSVGDYVKDNSDNITKITALAKESKNIKTSMENGSLEDIKINVAGNWVSLDDIDKLVNVDGDKCTISVSGESIGIDDKSVTKLLKMFKESGLSLNGESEVTSILGM